MSDQNNEYFPPLPTFSGNQMPLKVSILDDDQCGEETTRRVGFTPSFAPTTFDFAGPPSHAPPSLSSSTFATAPSTKIAPVSASSSRWHLAEAPTLPEFHPLERTAVFVPHSDSRTVSKRVSDVLKEQSIQATFDKNEAECVTKDSVDFSVYLYRGKKEYSHGIIVEVQRTYGNSFAFGETVQAILDAAEGDTVSPPPLKKTKMNPLVEEDDYEVSPSTSLASVYVLLQVGADAQLLGLETLSTLTDASKVGAKTASAISEALLAHPVASIVLDILDSRKRTALTTQAMILLSKVASNKALPSSVYPMLLRRLENAQGDSQMAYLAAQCISQDEISSRLADALCQAKLAAADQHDGLYKVCSKLLATSS